MDFVRIPSSTPTAPLSLDPVVLHIFNTSNGKVIGDGAGFKHHCEVLELALSQKGATAERQLAYIDKSYDLYLAPIRSSSWKMIHIGEAVGLCVCAVRCTGVVLCVCAWVCVCVCVHGCVCGCMACVGVQIGCAHGGWWSSVGV